MIEHMRDDKRSHRIDQRAFFDWDDIETLTKK